MLHLAWRERLMRSTRGRVLRALRRGARTIPELAEAMGLTDNAVRAHLTNLERDGMVDRVGRRRDGVGQPAVLYGLTSDGEAFFPKGYETVLEHTLEVLVRELGGRRAANLLRSVGRRIAGKVPASTAGLEERMGAARRALEELGALLEVREGERGPRLEGLSCPLAGVVPGHPQACKVVEALVEELVGAPVLERCERDGRPRCAFQVVAEGEG